MHKAALQNATARLMKTPIATLLTVLVVAVALSLPAAFQVIIKNLEKGQAAVNEQSRISLYLTKNASQVDIDNLLAEIKLNSAAKQTRYISADQGLQDFKTQTRLNDILDLMSNNPLPAVIHVIPDTQKLNPQQIKSFSEELAQFALVDMAKIDESWINRLFSITQFVKQVTIAISLFLIFTVLIVIGNTIKLLGQDFHDEIAVSKLVGATDGYVRRPFLYSGLIYGLLGGFTALCLVSIGLIWLTPQVEQLSQLHQTQLELTGLGFSDVLTVLSTGMVLGLGGAWVAANRLIHSLPLQN